MIIFEYAINVENNQTVGSIIGRDSNGIFVTKTFLCNKASDGKYFAPLKCLAIIVDTIKELGLDTESEISILSKHSMIIGWFEKNKCLNLKYQPYFLELLSNIISIKTSLILVGDKKGKNQAQLYATNKYLYNEKYEKITDIY